MNATAQDIVAGVGGARAPPRLGTQAPQTAAQVVAHCDSLLARGPAPAAVHLARGNALLALGRPDEALASLDRALALAPGDVLASYNRGNVLLVLGRRIEAVAAYERAVGSNPRLAPGWYNLGTTLMDLGRHAEAIASFDRVLALDPAMAAAHNNRAAALLALKRPEEAVAGLQRALQLRPDHAGALENLGNAQMDLHRFDEAMDSFRKALAAAPDRPNAVGSLLGPLVRCCAWSDEYFSLRARVADLAGRGLPAQAPFAFLATSDSAAGQLSCARTSAASRFPAAAQPLCTQVAYGHRRIRVAYVSAQFRVHPTALLAAELFERHDKEKFELTAISFGPDDGSPMRRRLERAFDAFLDVRGLDDLQIARLLRQREIDIAVDLEGFSTDCRLGIFAHRPSPVQVNYLGQPCTIGAPYIDYIVADALVIPPEHFQHYSEKVVHLPACYQPNGSGRPLAPIPPARAELGLPARGFVFCCFNSSYKITPEVFDVWMRLLHAVPASVLWLLDDNPFATANLRAHGARRGIDPSRLIFAPRAALLQHLARNRAADLFLDTVPCNAHTTASDALWAGLPVLTCQGTTFAARVAASLLHAAGLPELVTQDLREYEQLALTLAMDCERLAALRARLADNHATCPLFDAERYTRGLEAAFVLMWQRAERGLAPVPLAVPA